MKDKHLIALLLLIITAMLVICGGITYKINVAKNFNVYDSYADKLSLNYYNSSGIENINEDFTVDDNFSSHLPLIIIDTYGIDPPINTKFVSVSDNSAIGGVHIPIEGVKPYVDGEISVIDNGDSGDNVNRLDDIPAYSGSISIKRRGNTSMSYEKAQWLFKTLDEFGQETDVNILNMGAEDEWVLNGSLADKSMIRNYLAYSIASQILENTPDSRLCEVIIKNGDEYKYQGVYMLTENIKYGVNRVNISKFEEKDTYNSYLLRRDRYDANGLMLETYGRLNGFSKEYIALLYPSKNKVTDEMLEYVTDDINHVEEILYSDDPTVFSTYSNVIDVNSFIDYFLINEFFGNYDAGNNSTYFYKEKGGKLTMGPVWDFDGAMDNYMYEPFDVDTIAFYTKPWYDRLCLDKNFLKKLEKRYLVLKRTYLNPDYVTAKIDEIDFHLGGAIEREWYRWGKYYKTYNDLSLEDYTLKDGTILYRNAITHEDEIYRIKTMLNEHSKYIYDDIRDLEQGAVFNSGNDDVTGWLLLLAACLFIIPSVLAVYRQ
ncbi:MAG: CotH kinase family protein [Lachnospiraceae bacterium]|nr:CotH kinase family protein [Lachnospiraceae bacterium]